MLDRALALSSRQRGPIACAAIPALIIIAVSSTVAVGRRKAKLEGIKKSKATESAASPRTVSPVLLWPSHGYI